MRTSGNINQKLVNGSTCQKLQAESTGMRYGYVIYCSKDKYSCGSGIERRRSFGMQMIMHTNDILGVSKDYLNFCIQLLHIQ